MLILNIAFAVGPSYKTNSTVTASSSRTSWWADRELERLIDITVDLLHLWLRTVCGTSWTDRIMVMSTSMSTSFTDFDPLCNRKIFLILCINNISFPPILVFTVYYFEHWRQSRGQNDLLKGSALMCTNLLISVGSSNWCVSEKVYIALFCHDTCHVCHVASCGDTESAAWLRAAWPHSSMSMPPLIWVCPLKRT